MLCASPAARDHGCGCVKRALMVLLLTLTTCADTTNGAPTCASQTGATPQYACGRTLSGQGFIISDDYPPAVANGDICTWTLRARGNLFIAVFFADFNIGSTASLSVYNGANSTASNLLTTYFGSGPVGTEVVFSSSVVTLLFRSGYENLPNRAFGLSFASVSPPDKSAPGPTFSGCGGNLNGGGRFASPGNPGWYPNDASCQWTLTAPTNATKIRLYFSSFDLELNADFVIVYNGPTTNTTDVRRLTGSLLPFTLEVATTVVVQFISDPTVGRAGFSAQFSSVVPERPLNLTAACSASCPTTVTPDPGAFCYAHDDPHMRTFDGRTYELQKEGLFYLYRHDNAPIWVQAAFQKCSSYAACSCGVAVRYWDEVFVVDRCLSVGSQARPNRVYKSGILSMMVVEKIGIAYKVSLPNGLSILIGATWAWIGTVDLRAARGDRGIVQGACGLYDANPANDATYRLGYDPQRVQDPWMSWRVPENESLFLSTLPPYPATISSCDCSRVKNDNRLPEGVLWVNAQPVPNTQLSQSSDFVFTNDPNPGVIIPIDQVWRNNWNYNSAAAFCNDYVRQRPSIALCQKVAGDALDVGPVIENCIKDILLSGDTVFATTALEAAKLDCQTAISNKTDAEKNPILELMCPNECSNKGRCVKGVCLCQSGAYGADCSINPSLAPRLDTSAAVGQCQAAMLRNNTCYQENVFGTSFYNYMAGTPVCVVFARKTTAKPEGLVIEDLPVLRAAAVLISQSAITCPLQIVNGPYNVSFAVNYTISVSNDNLNFSNTVRTTRSFVPPCGGYLNTTGVVYSPNYPGKYYSDANCTWTLVAPAGKSVLLTFTAFSLPQKTDTFRILDSGLTVDKFSGAEAAGKTINYGQSVTVIFTSGRNALSTGFSIAFSSMPSPTNGSCGGQLVGRGSVQSPGSPSEYPSNSYCLWMLTADTGTTVRLRFTAFNLEESYDYLWIYYTGQKFASLTGNLLPRDFTAPSPVYLVFRSDDTNNFRGFNIEFSSQ